MILALAAALLLSQEVAISAKAFPGLDDEGLDVGCLTMTSGHTLSGGQGFGGYSGLSLGPDLESAVFLSDAGHLLAVDIDLTRDGRLASIGPGVLHGIKGVTGPGRNDTEALVPLEGNDWLVTREGRDDAVVVGLTDGRAMIERRFADLSLAVKLPSNKGFEAVAKAAADIFVFIPEYRNGKDESPILVWRDGALSRTGAFKGEADFAVTDLAADSEGDRVFVLERAFDPATGPRARLSVLPLSLVTEAGSGVLKPLELGRMSFFEGADNMEGMAFYRAADGSANLMLVSDDNFRDIQRTVLMTLRLSASCALAPAQP